MNPVTIMREEQLAIDGMVLARVVHALLIVCQNVLSMSVWVRIVKR